jgi:hypothetical protein
MNTEELLEYRIKTLEDDSKARLEEERSVRDCFQLLKLEVERLKVYHKITWALMMLMVGGLIGLAYKVLQSGLP